MICLLQALGKFFVNSPKREQELERCIKSNVEEKQFNIMKKKIKPLCETRWVERHTAFEDLHLLYKHVLDCLSNMKNNNNRMWDPKTVIETSGILNQITDVNFLGFFFHTCKFMLGFIKPLLTALRRSNMDVICVFTSIHREEFICLGWEFQGIDQRHCVEDVSFFCHIPSLLFIMKHWAILTRRFILFTH